MAKTLYIIDGHAHIYGAYYAPMAPLKSATGEPTKAVYVFTTAILGLLERRKPDMLVVTMDSKEPSFRTERYAEYKAHRPPMPEDLPGQIARIEQVLEAMKIPMLRFGGWEADDIIGTLTCQATKRGIDTFICSKDKDMLQLLNPHVVEYDLKNDEVIDTQRMMETMGLRPDQIIDMMALQGDTSDNVPGIPDVGPKTAVEWIKKYETLDNLYAHADEIKGKRGDNLRKFKEQAYLSRYLVEINCNAPVVLDEEAFAVKEPDEERLYSLYKELGFTRLSKKLTPKGAPDASQTTSKGTQKTPKGTQTTPQHAPATSRNAQGTLFDLSGGTASAVPEVQHGECVLVDTPEELHKMAAEFKKQKCFAFDTETTDLDPFKAELVGLSLSWEAHRAYYLPIKAPEGFNKLDLDLVKREVGPSLADPKKYKVAQNLKYDLLILENAGFEVAIEEGCVFDTMIASYCLHADRTNHSMDAMARDYLGYDPIPIEAVIGKGKNKLMFDQVDTRAACNYAAEDADVTWRLYEYLSMHLDAMPDIKQLFETIEMPLVEALARMEENGVSVNVDILNEMSDEMTALMRVLTDKIYALAGTPFNIDSPKQLSEILFDHLGLRSIRSGKTQRSTDAAVLEELKHDHPVIPLILEYRQLGKLKNTYTDKLGLLVNPRTGRIHASFNQTSTATGRLSSSDPNLQNIPIRTEIGRKIRSAFVPADPDGCILSADYSQIELRLLAHFSKDEALRKAFAEDQDIHRFVASQVYGVAPEEVTGEMRSKAKAVNFGIIYGQGPFGLSKSIGISQAEAKQFISDYYDRYPSIRAFMDEIIRRTQQMGYAETILHRRRAITGLTSKNFNVRSLGERLAVNTVIQGSAADLIKAAMIRIHRRIVKEKLPVKMILQIHDELVFEMPESCAAEHAKWICEEMTGAIPLDVPLKVDVSVGRNWMK
jgi:DNA polymerase-1